MLRLMNKVLPGLFLLLSLAVTPALAQKEFSTKNVAYWYDVHNDIMIDHTLIYRPDSLHIYLLVTANQSGDFLGNYTATYTLHKDYESDKVLRQDSLNLASALFESTDKHFYFRFSYDRKVLEDAGMINLQLRRKMPGKLLFYDIPLYEDLNFDNGGLMLFHADGVRPYFNPFLQKDEPVMLKSLRQSTDNIFVYFYNHRFDEALPPMIIDDRRVQRSLEVDSLFTIQAASPVLLDKEGLYFFQTDTATVHGVAVRVVSDHFPLCRTTSQVLEPLIYISTQAETESLRDDQEARRIDFEAYWLKLIEVPAVASRTIKNYYNNVESANFLFSNYKLGWKTDMGMIYTVFGPPDEVYKRPETMEWVYSGNINLPVTRFSFVKVRNIFSDQHYTLLRKKNYDRVWFRAVELWREGKIQ